MFIAALFTIADMWKQPKGPWTIDDWIRKCGISIHTMGYYSAVKRKKIVTYATT